MASLFLAAGITLFLLGFYTGIWVQRHSREVVEREVPKIITTEKVVEIKVPELIQIPTREAGGMAVIGQNKEVLDKQAAQEARRMQQLINEMAEV